MKLRQSEHLFSRAARHAHVRYLLFGLALCLLPALAAAGVMKSAYLINLGGVMIYAVAAMGLNLLLGYSGLISLGTAGFMGLGTYVAGYLFSRADLPVAVSVVAAVVIPTAVGILVGLVSLRISGLYLAIATLCVSEILRKTYEEFDSFTGGFSGLKTGYPVLFGMKLSRESFNTVMFVVLVIALVGVMMLTHNLVSGQLGRALHAMRGSEVAAQAMGVNLLKYRLIAFALATAYAGLAGALYMHFIRYSYPALWTLGLSLNILAVVVIGGLRSIYGTVLGALVVFGVPDLIIKNIPYIKDLPGVSYIFNGILIIVIIMFYPQGITRLFSDLKTLAGKPFGKGARG